MRLINKLSERDKKISDLRNENEELQEELDELQQYNRKPSIRVYGIPESEDEDTDQLLLQLFNKRMQLQPPVQLQEIEISHRVGRNLNEVQPPDQPSLPRAIIARFASRHIKAKVMKEKKLREKPAPATEENETDETNGSGTTDNVEDASLTSSRPIFISDDLTRRRAWLAKMGRDLRRRGKIRDTWVFDDRIMIKDNRNKVHEIRRESDFPQWTKNVCILWRTHQIIVLKFLIDWNEVGMRSFKWR